MTQKTFTDDFGDTYVILSDAELRKRAWEQYDTDDINVDAEHAPISREDTGTGGFVQAWVWVDYPKKEGAK